MQQWEQLKSQKISNQHRTWREQSKSTRKLQSSTRKQRSSWKEENQRQKKRDSSTRKLKQTMTKRHLKVSSSWHKFIFVRKSSLSSACRILRAYMMSQISGSTLLRSVRNCRWNKSKRNMVRNKKAMTKTLKILTKIRSHKAQLTYLGRTRIPRVESTSLCLKAS